MGRFGGSERGPAKRSDEETHSPARASSATTSAASSAGLSNRPTSGRASNWNCMVFLASRRSPLKSRESYRTKNFPCAEVLAAL